MNPKLSITAFVVTLGVLVGINQLLSVEQPGPDRQCHAMPAATAPHHPARAGRP